MADSAKKEKIAAARKKLKKFQKTGKGSRESTASPKSKSAKTQSVKSDTIEDSFVPNNNSEFGGVEVGDITDIADPIPGSGSVLDSRTSQSVSVQDNSLSEQQQQSVIETTPPTNTDFTEAPPLQAQEPISPSLSSDQSYQPSASTESLQQLSRQINGILAESPVGFETEQNQSDRIELETRNRELAALLAQHAQANEQLTTQNEQIRQHALSIQSQLEKERSEASSKLAKDIGPLKDQLQVHIQTIGILVAEKTELQSQLAQSHKIGDQRFSEVEDLTGRLKTSRQRVADLERSLANTNSSSQKLEQTSKESAKEVDRLKLELYKISKSQEETKQNLSETQEKFKAKCSECSGLQQSVDDYKRRLEMAELYSQQLTSQQSEGGESLKMLEQLQQERETLAQQLQQSTESLQRVSTERDQLSMQYQQYMEQLSGQNKQLTEQVTSLTDDREKLVTQNHDLETAVHELQRKLEDVSENLPTPVVEPEPPQELVNELTRIQTEYGDLQERHEAQIRDNAQLSRFLEDKETRIIELEGRIEELGEMAGDHSGLLEDIQSDKTALSRALTQNKDLKTQLAELQNGFVKMSNDNMEMLTQLQTEQHSSRDIQLKLANQEEEIKQFREMLSQKDSELQLAIENSVEANKVKLLHEQVQDRLRHYEAQAQLVETLQKELHASQDMSEALTTQNSELRTMLIRATETRALNPDDTVINAQQGDVIESLHATIQQLESERNQLMENLNHQRDLNDHLGVKVSDLQEECVQMNSSSDNDKVTKKEYEKVKYALDMIQDKYNRVMRDKADLSDKAEELEHLVLQLQGESDTIGEYISLYHHQRALLQQREYQKNEYINQLAKDREELQDKLGELQTLVMQLMGEKHMLHSYTQESNRPVSPNIYPTQATPLTHNNVRHDDWPDYTSSESDTESEVETIIGGKDDVTPESVIDNRESTPTEAHNNANNNLQMEMEADVARDVVDNHSSHHSPHAHHHTATTTTRERSHSSHSTHSRQEMPEDVTANKILNLLSSIGQSNLVDSLSFMEKQFHPCKYCKGRLQVL